MKSLIAIAALAAFSISGCSSNPEELVRNIRFGPCEALKNNSVWGEAREQAERDCAEFVGIDPNSAVGQTDLAQALGTNLNPGEQPAGQAPTEQQMAAVPTAGGTTSGSNNSLLYYMMMRDTFMGTNNPYYGRYALGANNLSSPMGMSYGVKKAANGSFSVPQFGKVNPASRVSSAVPVNSYTQGITRYSRGTMSAMGHK